MPATSTPDARLRDLGIANKHLVAVARAMSIDARDRHHGRADRGALGQGDRGALSARRIPEERQGKAILFISHKFDEIFRIADRYTVFRDGEMVGEGLLGRRRPGRRSCSMMVGRAVDHIFPERQPNIGAPVLAVAGLSHPTEFDDISFELRQGEILGFYGLVGAGRSEVMQAIFGITRTSRGSDHARRQGRSHRDPPPMRSTPASSMCRRSAAGRASSSACRSSRTSRCPRSSAPRAPACCGLQEEFALARSYTERLDLRASSLSQDVGTLSGGNQQKVVIAKWLATAPKVIILDEPTKGIDIGSKAAVHGFMAELVAEGLSVIMVSSELPEILGMSDRVVVMREGRIAAIHDNQQLDAETLVQTAAGIAA